jgi:hypothetical protein
LVPPSRVKKSDCLTPVTTNRTGVISQKSEDLNKQIDNIIIQNSQIKVNIKTATINKIIRTSGKVLN